MRSPLEKIPGVGKRTAAVMEAVGIRQVSDLRGRDPEELYLQEMVVLEGPAIPDRRGGKP